MPLHVELIAPHAYLAVDFFFLLSGFVVDRAYFRRLASGRFTQSFLKTRVVRLWPLIILGTVLGGVVSLVRLASTHSFDLSQFAFTFIFGVLLLPFGTLPSTGFIFPLNGPLWSLFYEGLSNLLYGVLFRRITTAVLIAMMTAAAVGIVYVAFFIGHLEVGSGKNLWEVIGGISRVGFSFSAGVLLSRIEGRMPAPSLPGLCLTGLVGVVLVLPLPVRNATFDFFCVLAVFPVLMFLGIRGSLPAVAIPCMSFLGEISYALYATHYPVMRVFLFLQERGKLSGLVLWMSIGIEVFACLAVAWIAMVFVDRPLRNRLSGPIVDPLDGPRCLSSNAHLATVQSLRGCELHGHDEENARQLGER